MSPGLLAERKPLHLLLTWLPMIQTPDALSQTRILLLHTFYNTIVNTGYRPSARMQLINSHVRLLKVVY